MRKIALVIADLMLALAIATGCQATFSAIFTTTSGESTPFDPRHLTQRLTEAVREKRTSRYAVIICGHCESFRDGVTLAYQVLLEQGYKGGDVFILVDIGNKTRQYPVAGSATVETVKKTLSLLGQALTPESSLFVYVSDHGRQIPLEKGGVASTIVLHEGKENLTDQEFVEQVADIRARRQVYLFDQCYGRAFVEGLRALTERPREPGLGPRPEIVAMAVAPPARLANDVEFPRLFFEAFRDGRGVPIEGVTIADAFDEARQNDPGTQKGNNKPYLYANPPTAADRGL